MNWGSVGYNESTFQDRTWRVLRTMETGVSYQRLDFLARETPLWSLVEPEEDQADGRTQYQLDLAVDPERDVETLYQLAVRLQGKRGRVSRDDPDLLKLDWAVARLLELVGFIHQRGQSVGVLHPLNVLWYTYQDTRTLVLPDVGFRWDHRSGSKPWFVALREPPPPKDESAPRKRANPADVRHVERTFWPFWLNRDLAGAPAAGTAAQGDDFARLKEVEVRALARMFDWVMLGTPRDRIPAPEEDERTTGQTAYMVLRKVFAEHVKDVTRLAGWFIQDDKDSGPGVVKPGPRRTWLSAFFVEPPRRAKRKFPPPWFKWLGAAVVVVGLLTGGFYLWNLPKPPTKPAPPVCPDCPPDTAGYPILVQFNEAQASFAGPSLSVLAQRVPVLLDRLTQYRDAVTAAPSRTSGGPEQEQRCLDKLNGLVWNDLDALGLEISKYLHDHPPPTPELQAATATELTNGILKYHAQFLSLQPGSKEDRKWQPDWLDTLHEAAQNWSRR